MWILDKGLSVFWPKDRTKSGKKLFPKEKIFKKMEKSGVGEK